MRHFLTYLCIALFITACGSDDPASVEKQATSSAPQQSMQGSDNSADGRNVDGIMIVDHSMDEIEFRLKRSLNSVISMIEQYQAEGLDTAELEAKKAELEKELKQLLSS